ncbi:1388_t:CDS:2, partial [Cetraspora pellucida]
KQFKEAGFNIQLARPTIGHPSLEETQPDLLEAIIQIVFSDGQADEKQSSELLHEALEHMNYKLSQTATYFMLFPKWHNSYKEKRHVKTVLVRLLRSQNIARRSYEDTHFCAALIRNIKEM